MTARTAKYAACLLLLGVPALGTTPLRTQSVSSREYTIKAAYLYNFGRYVTWPKEYFPTAQSPFVIGVLGKDPFGDALDSIAAGKRVGGRRIVVRRFASLGEYEFCHILFVPRSTDPQEQVDTIVRLRSARVLLVGETPGFARRGGSINFFVERNKTRFEINQEAAEREKLKISAKLLSLAKLVRTDNK